MNPDLSESTPMGYRRQELQGTSASILVPETWFYTSELVPGTNAYFVSKESLNKLGYFKTGLSINAIRKFHRKFGMYPDQAAEDMTREGSVMGEPLALRSIREDGPLHIVTASFKRSTVNAPIHVYNKPELAQIPGYDIRLECMLVGNRRTDTFWLINFECPVDKWGENEEIQRTMFDAIVIDKGF